MNDIPRVLAFDTASTRESVALLEGAIPRAELHLDATETHSALLLASVDFLLQRMGWRLSDLDLVAAGSGPGSFTGIRIGVATALGLAQTLDIPFAGVSGLDVLAMRTAHCPGRLVVVMDARRQQFYSAEYENQHDKTRRLTRPALLDAAEVRARLKLADLVAGDLTPEQWREALRDTPARRIPVNLFLATGVGEWALRHKRSWRQGEALLSEPLYIRPPDAIKNRHHGR